MYFFMLGILFEITFYLKIAAGTEHYIPRMTTTERDGYFKHYKLPRRYQRVELLQGPHNYSIYAGAGGSIFYLDFQALSSSKEVPVFQNDCNRQDPTVNSFCEYDITMLHEHKNGRFLFICGTNNKNPVCCIMSKATEMCESRYPGDGIAPVYVSERAPSLYIGDELYTTANMFSKGDGVGIRRHFGARGKVWPRPNRTEQIYLGMAVSSRTEKLQDRVYAFLVEKNGDEHREAAPWVSLVTQVCQADRGGPKRILQSSWTSLLSARLSCGLPNQKQYFSKLLDVTVLERDDWRQSRVYTLFSNSWGLTAVCVFTMGDIDHVFSTAKFSGYEGPVPAPRPGSCVEDSRLLPHDVLTVVMDRSEMEDWVSSVNSRPLLTSHQHYTHIRVDSVQVQTSKSHHVILLTLESGRVHKVLEQADQVFFIAELQPFTHSTHIHNVLLQTYTKKLYMSSSKEVVELDLQSCRAYGQRCEDCIQARDPYCGWNGTQCTAASSSTVQDVGHGDHVLCGTSVGGMNSERSSVPIEVQKLRPQDRYFLRCPMHSAHAAYSWHHGNMRTDCLVADAQCLLLIEAMGQDEEGSYVCMASEGGYSRAVVQYELSLESRAPCLFPATLLLLLLLVH